MKCFTCGAPDTTSVCGVCDSCIHQMVIDRRREQGLPWPPRVEKAVRLFDLIAARPAGAESS